MARTASGLAPAHRVPRNPCACRCHPPPDKFASPLPTQTLIPAPTHPANAPASLHQTHTTLRSAVLATRLPLIRPRSARSSLFPATPLIPPPPGGSRHSPPCCAPVAVSSSRNPGYSKPPHASRKTPAAATRPLQMRPPTLPLPPDSISTDAFQPVVRFSFLHWIMLYARKIGGLL